MVKWYDDKLLNKGRQPELDIAKGLAVLFMIAVHVLEAFSTASVMESNIGWLVEFLGGPPAAPVFMFLLGIGIIYSKKSTARNLLNRGLILLLGGYLLNFIRGTLPNLILYWKNGQYSFYEKALDELIAVDILQFAGLAFLFFALVRVLKLKKITIILLTAAFGVINLFALTIETNHFIFSAFTGLIWGSSEISFFPFLSWIVYPAAGYLFGWYLMRCSDKRKFYFYLFLASITLFIIATIIIVFIFKYDLGLSDQTRYYHHNLIGNIEFTAFVVSWISLLFFLTSVIPKTVSNTIKRWSNNLTEIYFIQWILIGWIVMFTGHNTLNVSYYFLLFVGITIASDLLAYTYKNRRIKIK
ncbi:acyltransferase family protein [Cohnella abietis]|uniref:Acyltransferase 3 domain-containing protein n=1 Tax=Cohnella abietis TaxID=2507935 RepID=A0A3T1D7W7_9BACL|nr:acyltransferase family protein [Cohnella abietis]BBI34176.1 hypothetical protein KCTCHS21_35750 [Cohnella abietis]